MSGLSAHTWISVRFQVKDLKETLGLLNKKKTGNKPELQQRLLDLLGPTPPYDARVERAVLEVAGQAEGSGGAARGAGVPLRVTGGPLPPSRPGAAAAGPAGGGEAYRAAKAVRAGPLRCAAGLWAHAQPASAFA